MLPKKQIIRHSIDTIICQMGTPKGIRASMIMGDDRGMIEAHIAIGLFGFCATLNINIRDIMIGSDMGRVNICALDSSSETEPIAANMVE